MTEWYVRPWKQAELDDRYVFDASDEFVAQCDEKECAAFIVRACNAHDDFYDLASHMASIDEQAIDGMSVGALRAALREYKADARTAIDRAEGNEEDDPDSDELRVDPRC